MNNTRGKGPINKNGSNKPREYEENKNGKGDQIQKGIAAKKKQNSPVYNSSNKGSQNIGQKQQQDSGRGDTFMIDTTSQEGIATIIRPQPVQYPYGQQFIQQDVPAIATRYVIQNGRPNNRFLIHALWQPKRDSPKIKLQLMIHDSNMKNKMFIDFERHDMSIGHQTFSIFTLNYEIRQGYTNRFQFRILDPGMISNDDFYEEYDLFHQLTGGIENQFFFNMSIRPKDGMIKNTPPPGESITEPLKVIVRFLYSLLFKRHFTGIPDLISQFQDRYPQLSFLKAQEIGQFCQDIDNLTFEFPDSTQQILTVLGIFPFKITNIRSFVIARSSALIQNGALSLVTSFQNWSQINKRNQDIFLKTNKVLNGFTLAMIANFLSREINWIAGLSELSTNHSEIFIAVIIFFLKRLKENDIKLSGEQIAQMKGMIEVVCQFINIGQDDLQDIYMLLLDQPIDFNSFVSTLQLLLPNDQNGDTFSNETQMKIGQTISRFQQTILNNLTDVRNYFQVIHTMPNNLKNYFTQLEAKRQVHAVFARQHYHQDSAAIIQLLKAIFIDFRCNFLLDDDSFPTIINSLLNENYQAFREVYNHLLNPETDHQLIKQQFKKYVKSRFDDRTHDLESLIRHFDELFLDMVRKQQNLAELCIHFAQELNNKCLNSHRSLLSSSIIQRLGTCRSNPLVQAVVKITKEVVILPNIRQPYQNPLSTILSLQAEFRRNNGDMGIVNDLSAYALGVSDERPNAERVKKQLIENPQNDHNWFKMIENYQYLNTQESVIHIVRMVTSLAEQIANQTLSIDDVLKIKNQSRLSRDIFVLYLHRALVCQGQQANLRASEIGEQIDRIIKNVENTLKQIDELRTFILNFLRLGEQSALFQLFSRHTANYQAKSVNDLKTFPPELAGYLEVAEKMYILQYSVIFGIYLTRAKEALNINGQAEAAQQEANIVQACTNAYGALKTDIDQISRIEELNNLPIRKIKDMLGNEKLNEAQVRKEIEIFERVANRGFESLKVLKQLLNSFDKMPTVFRLCQGILHITSISFTQKNNEGHDIIRNVFNFRMLHQIGIARNYIDQGVNAFDQITVQQYLQVFNAAQDEFLDNIERIVRIRFQAPQRGPQMMDHDMIPPDERDPHISAAQRIQQELENRNLQLVIQVLMSFSESAEGLIQFLRVIRSEDLEHLKEYVNDYDESGITTQTILDYIAIWDYIHILVEKYATNACSFEELIVFILENNQVPKFKEIDAKIKESINQLVAVRDLKNTLESKEEAKKMQVLEIMKQSDFKFNAITDSSNEIVAWNIGLFYLKNKKQVNFDQDSINELRDRALLIQHTQNQNMRSTRLNEDEYERSMEEQRLLRKYIELANLINATISNLTLLYKNGYPVNSDEFALRKFNCDNANFDEFSNFEYHVKRTQHEWDEHLINAYRGSYWLTFINGSNLWIIERYILGKNMSASEKKKAKNILQYMGKQSNYNQLRDYDIDDDCNDPLGSLNRLINLLDAIPQVQKANERQVLSEQILSKRDAEIFYLETGQPFEGIISMFTNFGRPFPRADQLFFCNESTSWQELQCFFYRCLKSYENELYAIVRPEQLSLDNQDKMTTLLQNFIIEEMPFKKFNFGIVTQEPGSHVASFFRQQEYTKVIKALFLLDEGKLKKIISQYDKTTLFVRSKEAGFGKTHFIRQQAALKDCLFVEFPIAGTLDFTEIGRRLSEVDLKFKTMLVFNISFVDKLDLLNEMLINLALFRFFKSPTDIFILPDYFEVVVELSNTYDDMFEKQIYYRKYVNEHYIEEFIIHNLQVKEDPIHDLIQYVCNHLLQYEQNLLNDPNHILVTLDVDTCIRVLEKFFVNMQLQNNQQPNFIQLTIFQRVLCTLLRNYKESGFFSDANMTAMYLEMVELKLDSMAQDMTNVRRTVFEAILQTVNEYTLKSINRGVRGYQQVANNAIMNEEGNDDVVDAINQELIDEFQMRVRWDSPNQNHFNALFFSDGTLMSIYKDPSLVPEAMRKLIYIQSNNSLGAPQLNENIVSGAYFIEDYTTLSHYELRDKLMALRTHGVSDLYNQDISYVITLDNFLKMCIIFLKIESDVPVIIMGETGCGKTSLIKYLCQNIRGDEIEVFNIHAGISYKNIIDQMRIYEIMAQDLQMQGQQKLWIFFDEFNTNENLGLICEILINKTLLGQILPYNMCFLAACNPYRLRGKNLRFDENVGIKRANAQNRRAQSRLLYTVYPLQDNIIEYVQDFGALTQADSAKYIFQMLTNSGVANIAMLTEMILEAHNYFSQNEDSSSVSLRDVTRFIKLYKFFCTSLQKKKELALRGESQQYLLNVQRYQVRVTSYRNIDDIDFRASMLALTHCYFLRLANMNQRMQLLDSICGAQTTRMDLTSELILEIVSLEQNDYLARMDLPDGTAVNLALKENIFTIIPCIFEKIPVFICGKPGCSKTLSISLIFSNLRGPKSQDEFFKSYPELTQVSFQGSDSCTSDGILKAYNKAKNYLKNDSNLLSVFVFDEIGLAEFSRHNPLKVLHSLLEVENQAIGFIGISNWRLDASKMNRALYLARPDPDEEDLKFTAMCIYQQICPSLNTHEMMIRNLASSYFELKNYYRTAEPRYTDFYGLRDFYHLIKQISRNLKDCHATNREAIYKIVKVAIQRNFGGKLKAAEKLWIYFAMRQQIQDIYNFIPDETVLDLIGMNLRDKNSRYLMLICKSEVAMCLLQRHFRDEISKARTLVGSNLENDTQKEEYGFRSLSDVILYAEKGIQINFKNMEHIYSSLYDLFNQHFSVLGDKKFCRIALGEKFNPKCQVHNDFRCIVFMSENDQKLLSADAPFLNRFEKHYLQLEDLLTEGQKRLVNRLRDWVNSLLDLRIIINGELQLYQTSIFPNYSQDNLGLIVVQETQGIEQDFDFDTIFQRCKEFLLQFATQDIIVLSHISRISRQERDFICDTYRRIHCTSFNQKLIEYTQQQDEEMSSLMDPSDSESNKINKLLAFTYMKYPDIGQLSLNKQQLNIRSLSIFKSEFDLVKHLEDFFQSTEERVFILQANYASDREHISFVKFIIEKVESESRLNRGFSKSIVLLLYMQRNFNELDESSLPLFEGWEQKMFYDISEQPFEITDELLDTNSKQLFQQDKHINFEQTLSDLTEKCLLKLQFEGAASSDQRDEINENLFFIMSSITNDPDLVLAFKEKLYSTIQQNESRVADWKQEICLNVDICIDSHNLESAFRRGIQQILEKYLTQLLFVLEKHSAFRSYFYGDNDLMEGTYRKLKEIWLSYFRGIKLNNIVLQNLPQSNYALFYSNLRFPFSRHESAALKEIFQTQTTFETNKDNLMRPIEHFAEQFNKKSHLGENIELLLDDQDLQRIYLNDILKIFLIENLLKPKYELILQFFLTNILSQRDVNFYQKLYTFIMKQQIFFSLCSVIDIHNEIRGGDVMRLEHVQQLFEEELQESNSWDVLTRGFIDKVIIQSYPDERTITKLGGMERMAAVFQKLHGVLSSIWTTVKLQNVFILKFWCDLAHLCATQGHQDFLCACSRKCQQYNDGEIFLKNDDFIEFVMDYFQQPEKTHNSQKFIALFLAILVDIDPRKMLYIATRFQNQDNLLKYSSTIFMKIMIQSRLITGLQNFKNQQQRNQDLEFELNENTYLDNLEHSIKQLGLNSKFSIAIADYIWRQQQNSNSVQQNLVSQFQNFEYFLTSADRLDHLTEIEMEEMQYLNIKKVVCHSFIKNYLDLYTHIIYMKDKAEANANMMIDVNQENEPFELTQQQLQRLRDVDTLICQSSNKSTLQIYCMKRLRILLGFSSQQLKNFMIDNLSENLQWARECDIINECNQGQELQLDLFPVIDRLSENENQLIQYIESIMRSNSANSKRLLTESLQEIQTIESKITVGLAFMKACFLKYYSNQNSLSPVLRTFFDEELSQVIEYRLGRPYLNLIECFISNFPRNHILHMGRQEDQNKAHHINISCYILILVLSYQNQSNPVSSAFFDNNGNLSVNNIRQSFLLGMELPPKYDILRDLLVNFQQHRNPNGNGTYACGAGCDYVYIVTNCGFTMALGVCPWCGKQIGGQEHVMLVRPGHTRLSDQEAVIYLQQLVTRYETQQQSGYSTINPPLSNSTQTYGGIRPATWRLLRLFNHLPMYFMMTIGGANEEAIRGVFNAAELGNINMNPKEFLEAHIKNDFAVLFQQLSSAGNDCQAAWLYQILGMVPSSLNQFQNQPPTSLAVRIQFEQHIDSTLITPNIDNIGAISQAYKQQILLNKGAAERKFDMLLLELEVDPQTYPQLELYRVSKPSSFEDMCASFNSNPNNARDHSILKNIIDNYDNLQKIRQMHPIIEFTSYALQKFDHMIAREQARVTEIKEFFQDQDGEQFKQLYQNFEEAWNQIGFENIPQYNCTPIEYIRYDDTSPLICFLIDNKEKEGGMCMAAGLQELSKLHNKILADIIHSYCKDRKLEEWTIIDQCKYPVQKVKKEHIISFKVDDPQLIKMSTLNNLTYGLGNETVYDFARLEDNLIKDIFCCKFIHTDIFEFVQYQLELMTRQGAKSALISEIRQKIIQTPFVQADQNRIDHYFNMIAQRNRQNVVSTLRRLHGGLEKILCYLHNSPDNNNTTIMDFCHKISQAHIENEYKNHSDLSKVQLSNITALYEHIERLYFPHIQELFSKDFVNENNKQQIKQQLNEFLLRTNHQAPNKAPSMIAILNALLRFMIRCLGGELNPEEELIYLAQKDDIWDESVPAAERDVFYEYFPQDLKLKNIYCVYVVINERNNLQENAQKGVQPNEKKKKIHQPADRDDYHDDIGSYF